MSVSDKSYLLHRGKQRRIVVDAFCCDAEFRGHVLSLPANTRLGQKLKRTDI